MGRGNEIGTWTDLYSVGCMAYELFTGEPPFFDAEEPLAILLRHVTEALPPASEVASVDPDISAWIEHLTAKERSGRPESATAAWEELEEILIAKLGPRWRRDARLPEPPQPVPGPATPPPSVPMETPEGIDLGDCHRHAAPHAVQTYQPPPTGPPTLDGVEPPPPATEPPPAPAPEPPPAPAARAGGALFSPTVPAAAQTCPQAEPEPAADPAAPSAAPVPPQVARLAPGAARSRFLAAPPHPAPRRRPRSLERVRGSCRRLEVVGVAAAAWSSTAPRRLHRGRRRRADRLRGPGAGRRRSRCSVHGRALDALRRFSPSSSSSGRPLSSPPASAACVPPSAARPAGADPGPLVLGLAGVALAVVALIVDYDGFSSLWDEVCREARAPILLRARPLPRRPGSRASALLGAGRGSRPGLLLADRTASTLPLHRPHRRGVARDQRGRMSAEPATSASLAGLLIFGGRRLGLARRAASYVTAPSVQRRRDHPGRRHRRRQQPGALQPRWITGPPGFRSMATARCRRSADQLRAGLLYAAQALLPFQAGAGGPSSPLASTPASRAGYPWRMPRSPAPAHRLVVSAGSTSCGHPFRPHDQLRGRPRDRRVRAGPRPRPSCPFAERERRVERAPRPRRPTSR